MRGVLLKLLIFIFIFTGALFAVTPIASAQDFVPIDEGGLVQIITNQNLGPVLISPVKYAIRASVSAGVPATTIVMILLLPVIATIIAAARHIIGLRGFGIFLPAALAIVFMDTGPIVGIGLFLVIIAFSTFARVVLRRTKVKLQYLPRMALILLFVVIGVLGVLFLAPLLRPTGIANVSIFPILILVLLAEDFTKIQIGKSPRVAIALGTETIILALVTFMFITQEALHAFAILNPELLLVGVGVIDLLLGKYSGLRFMEYWRYRKLLRS